MLIVEQDSPMMARVCEPEFVLDRLVESLVRYLRRNPPVDRFTMSLKERGEGALRMKTVSAHTEAPDASVQDNEDGNKVLKRTMSAPGLSSLVGKSSSAGASTANTDVTRQRRGSDTIAPVAPSLHVVEEEEHEHH